MPEALTQWKFLGFAHDNDLRSGSLQDKVVTAKDLMVQPNPPRFLREGDVLEFTVKVSNQANTPQKGTVRLTLADARTAKSIDASFGNTTLDQAFDIPAKESKSFSWRLQRPRRPGAHQLQGGRLDGPAVRWRGGLPARAVAAHPGDRIAALADPRSGDEEVRLRQAGKVRHVEDAQAPIADRADGVQSVLVRGDGPAVPDGISVRVQRTDLQSALCQFAGPAHRQFRSEDRGDLRTVEGHAGPGQSPGEEPGSQGGDPGGNALVAAGPGRKPGPQERRHPVRQEPPQRRDDAESAASWRTCSIPMGPGRGSPAVRPTITSRCTSPPASAVCATWA